MINPNLNAASKASDLLTNAMAQLRYTRSASEDQKEEWVRQIRAGASCLDALAFNGYDHAWDRLSIWRSELFRLGIAQELFSFDGSTGETSIRTNP